MSILLTGEHIDCPPELQKFSCQNPYILNPNIDNEEIKNISGIQLAFPCGKCLWCRKKKAKEWTQRLIFESLSHTDTTYFTLTYREYDPFTESELFEKSRNLCQKDIQNFMKHIRREFKRLYNLEIRMHYVGEYGELSTQRAHWHGLLFGINYKLAEDIINKVWKHGRTDIQPVSSADGVAAYVSGYVTKKIGLNPEEYEKIHKRKCPFHRGSKGLGLEYALKNFAPICKKAFEETGDFSLIKWRGKNVMFDRYLKNKIAEHLNIVDEMKELAIQKCENFTHETIQIWNTFAKKDELAEIVRNIPTNKYEWYQWQAGIMSEFRKALWYRGKARAYRAEKYHKIQELKKADKKAL